MEDGSKGGVEGQYLGEFPRASCIEPRPVIANPIPPEIKMKSMPQRAAEFDAGVVSGLKFPRLARSVIQAMHTIAMMISTSIANSMQASISVLRLKWLSTPRQVCRVISATSITNEEHISKLNFLSVRVALSECSTQRHDQSVTPVEIPNRVAFRNDNGSSHCRSNPRKIIA